MKQSLNTYTVNKTNKKKALKGLKRPECEGIILVIRKSDWIINVRKIL